MAILDKLKKTVKGGDTKDKGDDTKKDVVAVDVKKEKKSVAKTKDISYYNILKEPYITEKSSMMGQENKYVFKVLSSANKIDVKKAVEGIYDVKVTNVAVINIPSKKIRLGRNEGRRPGFKKAIVQLKEGDKIDIGV